MIWITIVVLLLLTVLALTIYIRDNESWEDVYATSAHHTERAMQLVFYLKEHDVDCQLNNMGSMHGESHTGVGVRVRKSDLSRARELVEAWKNRFMQAVE